MHTEGHGMNKKSTNERLSERITNLEEELLTNKEIIASLKNNISLQKIIIDELNH